jgi:hypothetical protein
MSNQDNKFTDIDRDKIMRLVLAMDDHCKKHQMSQIERLVFSQMLFRTEIIQNIENITGCDFIEPPEELETFLADKINQVFSELSEYGIKYMHKNKA